MAYRAFACQPPALADLAALACGIGDQEAQCDRRIIELSRHPECNDPKLDQLHRHRANVHTRDQIDVLLDRNRDKITDDRVILIFN